jgi:hypothetical protein
MNPVLEEEEGEPSTTMSPGIEKEGAKGIGPGDYSSGGSGSNHRNSSPASSLLGLGLGGKYPQTFSTFFLGACFIYSVV